MPYYSELGLKSMPSSSVYSSLLLSGPYSNHSSIIASNFTPYSKTRNYQRGYRPHLSTINELNSNLRRVNSPKIYSTPQNVRIRPIKIINTADIDVSKNKYRKYDKYEKPRQEVLKEEAKPQEKASSPKLEETEAKPNPTIRRDRTTVRLRTVHKDTVQKKIGAIQSWRDNFQPEELGGEEKRVRKTQGEILKEKFLIRSKSKENLKVEAKPARKKSIRKSPSFHDICKSITSDAIDNELNPGQPVEIQRRQSKQFPSEGLLKEIRRNSLQLSEDELDILDVILARPESATTLPIGEAGPNIHVKKKKLTKKKPSDEKSNNLNNMDKHSDVPELTTSKIRDISQVDIEQTVFKPKTIITASVGDIDEIRTPLKAVVDHVEVQESPKPKKEKKFRFNISVEVDKVKKVKHKKDPLEKKEGTMQVPKTKVTVVSSILKKHPNVQLGSVLEPQIQPSLDSKKKTVVFDDRGKEIEDQTKSKEFVTDDTSTVDDITLFSRLYKECKAATHSVEDNNQSVPPELDEMDNYVSATAFAKKHGIQGDTDNLSTDKNNFAARIVKKSKSDDTVKVGNKNVGLAKQVTKSKSDEGIVKIIGKTSNAFVENGFTNKKDSVLVDNGLKKMDQKAVVVENKTPTFAEVVPKIVSKSKSDEAVRDIGLKILPKSKSDDTVVKDINKPVIKKLADVNKNKVVVEAIDKSEVDEEIKSICDNNGIQILEKEPEKTDVVAKENLQENLLDHQKEAPIRKISPVTKSKSEDAVKDAAKVLNKDAIVTKSKSDDTIVTKKPLGAAQNKTIMKKKPLTESILAATKPDIEKVDEQTIHSAKTAVESSMDEAEAPENKTETALTLPEEETDIPKRDEVSEADKKAAFAAMMHYTSQGSDGKLSSSEGMQNTISQLTPNKKIVSKRSLIQKARKVDPDLDVFDVPEAGDEDEEEEEKKDVFVPLRSNRLSQWMHPWKKPEQHEVCPVEIYAKPKVIRGRHYPRPKGHPAPQPDDEETEDESSSEDETSSTSTEAEAECEGGTAAVVGASTSSVDSGFGSGAACKKDSLESRDSPTSSQTNNSELSLDTNDIPEEFCQSSTFAGFQKTGRITPPATTIPRFRKYCVDDFNFLKVLGKGSFGKVLLAELKGTDYYYAVKCLKKDVVLEDDDVECTLIERKVLALGTKHPYLCHLLCTFQTESHLFFVMEYLNGGDLMFHIQAAGRFPEHQARFYGAEIVSGLKFLHSKGIVYRDLKLDNVLLDFDGHVRIADFGMCKLQIFLDRMAESFCGTPDYMAPEIIKGLHYNQSVDWWSFGVLLYEMLLGQSPFSGCDEDELFWSICNEKPVLPKFLSTAAVEILTMLLEKDAAKRLGNRFCPHGNIQDQEFFKAIDWYALETRQLEPPFKPHLQHPLDTQYFDKHFTVEKAKITPVDTTILASIEQTQFQGFSYTNPNATDK